MVLRKMKLKTPEQYRNEGRTIEKPHSPEELAQIFVNGKLRKDIETAIDDNLESVNTEVPFESYRCMKKFVEECKKILVPLGYTAEESHDGGGMYGTLYVTWK